MAGLPFRVKQLIVSTIGALLLLPLDFFFGGIFAFSFGAQESLWAWIFGLTAFWFQIFGILLSFFKPRPAAIWILANIAVSCFVRFAVQVNTVYGLAAHQPVLYRLPQPLRQLPPALGPGPSPHR